MITFLPTRSFLLSHNPLPLHGHLHVAFIIRQAIIVKIFASFTFDGVFEIYYYETTWFDYWRASGKHYKALKESSLLARRLDEWGKFLEMVFWILEIFEDDACIVRTEFHVENWWNVQISKNFCIIAWIFNDHPSPSYILLKPSSNKLSTLSTRKIPTP